MIYYDLFEKFEINYTDSCQEIVQQESKKRSKLEIMVPPVLVDLSRLKRKRGRISEFLGKESSIGSKKAKVINNFL